MNENATQETVHAFSNGALGAQLVVKFHPDDVHVLLGNTLKMTATKEQVRDFLSDLDDWAFGHRCPECGCVNSEPEEGAATATTEVPEETSEQVDSDDYDAAKVVELVAAIELVLELVVKTKPNRRELGSLAGGVSSKLCAQALEHVYSLTPEEYRPVVDFLRSL